MRTCKKCGTVNEGRGECKPCHAAYMRWYLYSSPERRERKKQSDRDYRKRCGTKFAHTPMRRFHAMISNVKTRGIPVELTFGQYLEVVADGKCSYCGDPLPLSGSGIDRKNSCRGYSISNVVPACSKCNNIRGKDLVTYEEMKYIMPLLVTFREEQR